MGWMMEDSRFERFAKRSQVTLDRLQRDDPTLTGLEIVLEVGDLGMDLYYDDEESSEYFLESAEELSLVGGFIGSNTHLKRICFSHRGCSGYRFIVGNVPFFEGLRRNSTIESLEFLYCDITGSVGRPICGCIFTEFVMNNTNLTKIELTRCISLSWGGAKMITSAVASCPNIESIIIYDCCVDDNALAQIVAGVTHLRRLREFVLAEGRDEDEEDIHYFGFAGCKSLASLLQDPGCHLTSLGLSVVGLSEYRLHTLDNDCIGVLAQSLRGNNSLEELSLEGNDDIDGGGWEALSSVLCDTSCINATYSSNHTLNCLGKIDVPTSLSSLLQLNDHPDKKRVAVKKILRCHSNLDMEPFLEWDLKVLPLAVNWFDGARRYATDEEGNVDARKLSAIYQFARALPLMVVPPVSGGTKRKIDQTN